MIYGLLLSLTKPADEALGLEAQTVEVVLYSKSRDRLEEYRRSHRSLLGDGLTTDVDPIDGDLSELKIFYGHWASKARVEHMKFVDLDGKLPPEPLTVDVFLGLI